MSPYLFLIVMVFSPRLYANTLFSDQGFHWYSKAVSPKVMKPVAAPQQATMKSEYKALMALQKEAKEALAKALLKPGVENTVAYMRSQHYFMQVNQAFIRNWEKALLLYPELDFKLQQPTDGNAIILKNEEEATFIERAVKASAKEFGFLLFYRGKSPLSNKFATMLNGFIRTYHIEMIPVATDNQAIPSLPKTSLIAQNLVEARMGIKAQYEPAVFLVHLKTKQIQPLSYGFMAYEEFKKRFFDVVTNFKRFSDEGIGR